MAYEIKRNNLLLFKIHIYDTKGGSWQRCKLPPSVFLKLSSFDFRSYDNRSALTDFHVANVLILIFAKQ